MTVGWGERNLGWLNAAWDRIGQRIDSGRMPHAILLSGPAGIGKRAFAAALAERLLCSRESGSEACGHCRNCELQRAGTHPDFRMLQPEQVGKSILVGPVREVVDFVTVTPMISERRVIVLCPAESMNRNAANALLKTLEEPGAGVHLILVSHAPSLILPTVRSRCEQVALPTPAGDEALAWLQSRVPGGVDAAELLEAAGGAPLSALEQYEDGSWELRGQWLNGLAEMARGESSALELAESWSDGDLGQLLESLYLWAYAILRGLTDPDRIQPDRKLGGLASFLDGRIDLRDLYGFIDELIAARRAVLSGSNPNRQLLLENLLLAWPPVGGQGTGGKHSASARSGL